MIIIMLGAQGTGKGTVAGLLSNELHIPQISTGDVFRKNIKDKTELGEEANKYISKGQLVPDEITIPMVINELDSEQAKNGAILDGFPRTIEQAQKLKEILSERNNKLDLVINLISPRDEIITRIVDRRVCPNCKATFNLKLHPPIKEGICDNCGHELKQREDDMDEQSIKNRLEIYDKQTSPLVEYYKKEGILRTEEISLRINRMGKDVAEDIIGDLKKEGKI
ncbi:MAG: adenylate kinase [Clostridia bacterium]|nr:adenylate kinase [Clostridia bacterium]